MASSPSILVAVSTCNLQERLPAVLQGFCGQTFQDFRLLLLDDASTDATTQAAQTFVNRLNMDIAPSTERLGRSRNRNRVSQHLAKESIIIFWDGDMVPAPDLVETHWRFHAQAPSPASLYGRVHFEGKSRLALYLNSRPLEQRKPLTQFPLAVPGRKLLTSNFSLRTSDFIDSQGFDELFHYWGGEDMEFGMRLAALGIKLYYNPAAKGYHPDPGPVANFVNRHREYGEFNMPIIVSKYPELRKQLRLHLLASCGWRTIGRRLDCPACWMEFLPNPLITALIFQRYASGFEHSGK